MSFVIRAKDEASKVLEKVANTTKEVDKSFKLLNPTVLGVSIGFAGLVAVATKAINAFAESELATKKLNDALKNAGVFSEVYSKHLESVGAELQKVTRFSDEQVTAVQELLVTFGVYGKTLDDATRATLDMAETMGIDAQSAARIMSKAVEGNTDMLKRYGITVSDSIPKNKKFAEALKQIQERMGGRAGAAGDTVTGAFAQFKNAMSDVLEVIGKMISDLGALQNIMKTMAAAGGLITAFFGEESKTALQKQIQYLGDMANILQAIGDKLPKWLGGGAIKDIAKDAIDLQNIAKARLKEITEEETKAVAQAQKMHEIKQALIIDEAEIAKKLKEEHDLMVKRNELEKKRIQYIEEVADKYEKLARDQKVAMLNSIAAATGNAASGNIGGLIGQGVTSMAGGSSVASAGPLGAIAAAAIELVMHAKELPKKIAEFLSGFVEGLTEGIPTLMKYLSTDFLKDFMTKVIPAFVKLIVEILPLFVKAIIDGIGTLLKNLPNMLVGIGKGIVSGIWDGVKGIGGAIADLFGFGDGPSPQELMAQAIRDLIPVIIELNKNLGDAYRNILDSIRSPEQKLLMAGASYNQLSRKREGLIGDLFQAGLAGDEEKMKELLEQIKDTQISMMNKAKEAYDLEMENLNNIYQERKKIYDEERNAILRMIDSLKSMKDTAVNAFRSAREAILGQSLGPNANVDRLRSAFQGATTAEGKSSAATAYAGSLQQQYSSYQALAASGAITGEEFARIQKDILGQLDEAESQSVNYYDKLISIQEKQLIVLDKGFAKFEKAIEAEKLELKAQLMKIGIQLSKLPTMMANELSASISYQNPTWTFRRTFDENTAGLRGRISTKK